MSGFEYGQLGA